MTPSSPKLSLARIIEAAVDMADAEGLDQVSTRSLAARLGVTPMALYRHVRDKDDIVTGVVDVLLARHAGELDSTDGGPARDWHEHLRWVATSLRAVLRDQSEALRLFTRRPVTSPAARARLADAIRILASAGFDEASAIRAYASVHTYTIGFCALEAGRRLGSTTAEDRRSEEDRSGADRDLELASMIRGFVSDDQFRQGLDSLIAGLGGPRP